MSLIFKSRLVTFVIIVTFFMMKIEGVKELNQLLVLVTG